MSILILVSNCAFHRSNRIKISMLRLNIGCGSAHACSALAEDPKQFKARVGGGPLALNGFGSEAIAELA